MLDVRKPLGLLFMILGGLLFLYGQFFSEHVPFLTPNALIPLKLNQPVGAFMFVFGIVMWQLSRFVEIHTADRELSHREKELDKVERKRQKALARQQAADPQSTTGDANAEPEQSAPQSETPADTKDEAPGDSTASRE